MRILILDDQEPVVSMLARVCTGEGHEVTTFTSSPEALLALVRDPAAPVEQAVLPCPLVRRGSVDVPRGT